MRRQCLIDMAFATVYLFIYYSDMEMLRQRILSLLAMYPDGLSASELRSQLSPQVSQPTLWRRLDQLRAQGRVLRSGRGRATRYHRVESGHDIADLRSKALHMEVGRKLLREPELFERTLLRLKRMRRTMPHARTYVERWENLISGPIDGVLRILGGDDEDAKALRHASPFAGVLSEKERLTLLRRQGLLR